MFSLVLYAIMLYAFIQTLFSYYLAHTFIQSDLQRIQIHGILEQNASPLVLADDIGHRTQYLSAGKSQPLSVIRYPAPTPTYSFLMLVPFDLSSWLPFHRLSSLTSARLFTRGRPSPTACLLPASSSSCCSTCSTACCHRPCATAVPPGQSSSSAPMQTRRHCEK